MTVPAQSPTTYKRGDASNENAQNRRTTYIAVIGILIVIAILVIGTVWMGRNAQRDTAKAVHSVSTLLQQIHKTDPKRGC